MRKAIVERQPHPAWAILCRPRSPQLLEERVDPKVLMQRSQTITTRSEGCCSGHCGSFDGNWPLFRFAKFILFNVYCLFDFEKKLPVK